MDAPLETNARLVRDCLATPKVLVVASADADALCRKNGLSLTQLMRPFGRIPRKGQCFFSLFFFFFFFFLLLIPLCLLSDCGA